MSYSLTAQQLDQILHLSPEQRYDYFVQKVAEHRELWSLRSDKGWVMLSSEGDECLPIWPHPDFAKQWVTDDWADCAPTSLDLDAWLKRWLPGMQKDGVALAVFPSPNEEGIVVEPDELAESLKAAI